MDGRSVEKDGGYCFINPGDHFIRRVEWWLVVITKPDGGYAVKDSVQIGSIYSGLNLSIQKSDLTHLKPYYADGYISGSGGNFRSRKYRGKTP
jgi:hypothetical protein